ncbi:MAG: molybdenum cofactor guanylyltransferase MobA [Paracoccaceae bacterium]
MRLAGVILAGGLATRMGGGDKALLPLGAATLLDQVIARLQPQVEAVVLNANGDAARFARFGLPVVADSVAGFAGPLAGVLAGLDWAQAQGFDAVLSVAGDTPFFPQDLAARLIAAREGQPIAMAAGPGEARRARHPTFALWDVSLADALRLALNEGTRKVVQFSDAAGCATCVFDDGDDAFFNVNTPEDLALAQVRVKG